ncbi:MAG: hypothetical protein H7843_01660 [Nitrospirota bacterium]
MTFTIWVGFILLSLCHTYKKRQLNLHLFYLVLPILLTILSYLAFLHFNNAFRGFMMSIIDYLINNLQNDNEVVKRLAGYDQPVENILLILKSSILQLTALYLLFMICNKITINYNKTLTHNSIIRIVPFLIILVYAIFIGQLLVHFVGFNQYRFLNLLFIGGILYYAYKFIKSDTYNKDYLMLLTVFLISFVLTSRILLKYITLGTYGFYLLPMGLICYYIFYVRIFPSFYIKIFNTAEINMRYYYISILLLLAQLSVPYYYQLHLSYYLRNITVNTVVGKFMFRKEDRLLKTLEMAGYLANETPNKTTLAVFPEGMTLNILAQKNTPLPYRNLLPTDVATIGEHNLINIISKEKIDYIAILNSSMVDFGYDEFKSYANNLYKWIVENYTLNYVVATPLENKKIENITSYTFNDVDSLDSALQNNYKSNKLIILLFKRR